MINKTAITALVLSLSAGVLLAKDNSEIQEYKVDKSIKLPTAPEQARKEWKDKRFGMFIHWGPISQMGKQLSHSRNSPSHHTGGKPYKVAEIPPEVYDVQYKTFNPTKFDPDKIVKMAKAAGVGYIVFTAKHHAGFSMFDSAVSDYDIMAAPYKKDIVKMLSDACKKNDVKFGFYYSPRDWHHPDCDSDNHHDRYIKFFENQMHELLTKYGPIYEIWFDGLGPGKWGDTSKEVMNMIRKLHPNAMVNDRGGAGADFYTPEQDVSYFNRKEPWEACHTTTGQWGYNPKTHARKFPLLMEILLYTWGGDGNILLNIGPRGDGSVNPEEAERFKQLAEWWKVHGETSIRGTRGGPYMPGPWGVSTCKNDKVYLHIFRWPPEGGLHFPALKGLEVQSARLLTDGKVELTKDASGFTVNVPTSDREKIVTTVELTFNGETLKAKPLHRVDSLTLQAKLTGSDDSEHLKNLTDMDADTYWNPKLKKGEKEIWLEADFDKPVTIGSFYIGRGDNWSPKAKPTIMVMDSSGKWKDVTPKRLKLRQQPIKFLNKPVTTTKVKLIIKKSKKFNCAEFELYPPVK